MDGGFQQFEYGVSLLGCDLFLLLEDSYADVVISFRGIRVDIDKLLRGGGFADIHNSTLKVLMTNLLFCSLAVGGESRRPAVRRLIGILAKLDRVVKARLQGNSRTQADL